MKDLFQNVFFKMGIIATLILLLLIPAIMVEGLIQERMLRQNEAINEVNSKHADDQTITGPILTIPYKEYRFVEKNDGSVRELSDLKYLHILPEQLTIRGEVKPEVRKRGIYEVVVYGSDLTFSGAFQELDPEKIGITEASIQWDKAFITLGIPDLKGLNDQVLFTSSAGEIQMNPGVLSDDIVSSGLNAPLVLDSTAKGKLDFSFDLEINGSESLMFLPIGKVTEVDLKSAWSEPSFDGKFLPKKRSINDKGFTANWKILHLNRNYPQQWVGSKHSIHDSAFGVNLRLPVDVYQKSERVTKYAILFIALTYLVFFFVEILNKILIHPIQYILVGFALILFYVLLLAFSEQIHFDMAYLTSAAMTIGMVTLYCRSILKRWNLAMMTSAILTILYGFIFIIIQMQDLALLFGSLGIFLILAVTMYFSRKIDWFELKKEKSGV